MYKKILLALLTAVLIAGCAHCGIVNILREALASPDKPIHQLAVLSPAERERVLYLFNHSARPNGKNLCLLWFLFCLSRKNDA